MKLCVLCSLACGAHTTRDYSHKNFNICGTCIRWRLDTRAWTPNCVFTRASLTSLRPSLAVSAPSAGVLNVREVENVPLLVHDKECVCKMHSSDWEPLLSPFVDTDVIKEMDQALSAFVYCK